VTGHTAERFTEEVSEHTAAIPDAREIQNRIHWHAARAHLAADDSYHAREELRRITGALPIDDIAAAATRAIERGWLEDAVDLLRLISDVSTLSLVGDQAWSRGQIELAIGVWTDTGAQDKLVHAAEELAHRNDAYGLMLAKRAYRHAGVTPPRELLERSAEMTLADGNVRLAAEEYTKIGGRPSRELACKIVDAQLAGGNVRTALMVCELAELAPEASQFAAAGERLFQQGRLSEAVTAFEAAGSTEQVVAIAKLLLESRAIAESVPVLIRSGRIDIVTTAAEAAYRRGDHHHARSVLGAAKDRDALIRYGDELLVSRRQRSEAAAYYDAAERISQG
jgi:tetratricopeptide (TPR) repeat protein